MRRQVLLVIVRHEGEGVPNLDHDVLVARLTSRRLEPYKHAATAGEVMTPARFAE